MDAKRSAEIKARCEAATPGPWFWDTNRRYWHIGLKAPHDGGTMVMDFVRWGMHSAQPRFNNCQKEFGGILLTANEYDENPDTPNPNADFIAHARQDVPDLLAEVERQAAEVERQAAEIERLRGALEFYAVMDNWKEQFVELDASWNVPKAWEDNGHIAREALKGGTP